GGTIQQARLAGGGGAARPWRVETGGEGSGGQPREEGAGGMAGEKGGGGGQALRVKAHKNSLMRNLVERALPRGSAAGHNLREKGVRPLFWYEAFMNFLTWGRNPWGQRILTHVSWDLLWASLFAGVMFLVAHASYMILSAHRKRAAAETDALEAANKDLPEHIPR